MRDKWICLVIGRQLVNKGDKFLNREFSKKIGKTFKSLKIFDDGLSDDSYAFIKVSDINKAIVKIRDNGLAISALPNWDNPSIVGEDEIESLFFKKPLEKLCFGDLVYVSGNSIFSNLYGLVVSDRGNLVDVFFRFHMFGKSAIIERKDLVFHRNCSHIFEV